MIVAFFAPLLAKYGLRIAIGAALIAAVAGGWFWFIEHERAIGAENLVAKEQARAKEVEGWAQSWAAGSIQRVDNLEKQNAERVATTDQRSASNNGVRCLDSGAGDRLRAIRRAHPAH
jgi:hypothetical protein